MLSYQYKDEMVSQLSYLYRVKPHIWKRWLLYLTEAQETISMLRCSVTSKGIPMIKIRSFHNSLIFLYGNPHTWKDGLFIETGPDDEGPHGISSSYVRQTVFNSLAPGRCGNKFKSVAPKQMVRIKIMGTYEIALGECSRIPLMKSHHWFR